MASLASSAALRLISGTRYSVSIFRLGNNRSVKGVCFDDIRAGVEELPVKLFYQIRPGEIEHFVVTLEVFRMTRELTPR